MDKKEKHELVMKCRASGMTAKEWCKANGITYRQYCDWTTLLNKDKRSESQHETTQWANVTITKEYNHTSEIKLSCGKWTILVETGFNPELLADVLRVVDDVC